MRILVQRLNYQTAVIIWTAFPDPNKSLVRVQDTTVVPQAQWNYYTTTNILRLPLRLDAGHVYSVTVQVWLIKRGCTMTATSIFRADFTRMEMEALFLKATRFAQLNQAAAAYDPVESLYHSGSYAYFSDACDKTAGIMKGRTTDIGGDPASNVSRQVNGLLLATHISPHTDQEGCRQGEYRLVIPAAILFDNPNIRLYLADFYCSSCHPDREHHVTLVLTHSGSMTDWFCKARLKEVKLYANHFLFRRDGKMFVTRDPRVEVLFTPNLDLHQVVQKGAYFYPVQPTGTCREAGMPKNRACNTCNLY